MEIELKIDVGERGKLLVQTAEEVDGKGDRQARPKEGISPQAVVPAARFRRGHEFEGNRGEGEGEALVMHPLLAEDCREEELPAPKNGGDEDSPEQLRNQEGGDGNGLAAQGINTEPVITDDGRGRILGRGEPCRNEIGDRFQPRIIAHEPERGDDHGFKVAHEAAGGNGRAERA